MKKIQGRKIYIYVVNAENIKQVREIKNLVYAKLENISLEHGTDTINAVSAALSDFPVEDISLKKEHGKRTINVSLKTLNKPIGW